MKYSASRTILALSLPFLLLTGCATGQEQNTQNSTAKMPDSFAQTEPDKPKVQIPEQDPGSEGCADMDKLLIDFIDNSPQGKAFTDAQLNGASDISIVWRDFVDVFVEQHEPALEEISHADESAFEAYSALHSYRSINNDLVAGKISEYVDGKSAEEAIKLGEEPERNPQFDQAITELTQSHITLTTCLPHWPVVF
ncbi:hypothetical protein JTE88_00360 [Arcanobacterium phocisimile]|uniref:Lipoprotein n=1 Tax=Arcanobacterium phocisimile TaxID=1302235 RepID=A0ABX7IHN7_9ACTO|nr:hypothetical protein [Arcanobacterium phocisimile]QRV02250.1 hypothetical protein JTE88_00360 [Arcanobacterium phocisimile]